MTLLIEYTLKVSLVVAAGLVMSVLLRRQSAAGRHWVLSMALLAALTVPIVSTILPGWPVVRPAAIALGGSQVPTRSGPHALASPVQESVNIERLAATPTKILGGASLAGAIAFVWAAGTGLSLALLIVGLARLTWLASSAQAVSDPTWTRLLREIVDRQGPRRAVRVLHSDHPSLLVTWGVLRPAIIVPHAALQWPEERIRVVLSHELAHVRRADWAMQIGGELVRSLYWFNPLIWIACRQLRHESEEACDDEVIAGGVDGSDYAAHLLDAARALKGGGARWLPAPAIVRPSSLERRIRVMLNTGLRRTPTTRVFRVAAAVSIIGATALVGAAQIGPATVSGSVVDASGAPVPGAAVQLTSKTTGAAFSVKTDASGRYQFVPLPGDDYALTSRLPGFKEVEDTVQLAGKSVRRDLKLALGELKETITIAGGPSDGVSGGIAGGVAGGVPGGVAGGVLDSRIQGVIDACKPTSVGGNLRAPRKLKDVRPTYAENLRAAGVTGSVVLSATIGTDGKVTAVDVLKSVHPDLDAAAADAVRQWLFEPALLNCAPSDVKMTVTLNFNAK